MTALVAPPLAHAGHWIEAVVYLVPILGFAVWLGVATIKDKRKQRQGGEGSDGGSSG
jgi:hypothetical protein